MLRSAILVPAGLGSVLLTAERGMRDTHWDEEDVAEYVDYLADFRAEFHDIRGVREYAECLSPSSYVASQALAARLLEMGSSGIVYPCVRRAGGTCIVCFRPVLVINVRKGDVFSLTFPKSKSAATIRRVSGSSY